MCQVYGSTSALRDARKLERNIKRPLSLVLSHGGSLLCPDEIQTPLVTSTTSLGESSRRIPAETENHSNEKIPIPRKALVSYRHNICTNGPVRYCCCEVACDNRFAAFGFFISSPTSRTMTLFAVSETVGKFLTTTVGQNIPKYVTHTTPAKKARLYRRAAGSSRNATWLSWTKCSMTRPSWTKRSTTGPTTSTPINRRMVNQPIRRGRKARRSTS